MTTRSVDSDSDLSPRAMLQKIRRSDKDKQYRRKHLKEKQNIDIAKEKDGNCSDYEDGSNSDDAEHPRAVHQKLRRKDKDIRYRQTHPKQRATFGQVLQQEVGDDGKSGSDFSSDFSSTGSCDDDLPSQALLRRQCRKDKDCLYRSNLTEPEKSAYLSQAATRMQNHRNSMSTDKKLAMNEVSRNQMEGTRRSERARPPYNPSEATCRWCHTDGHDWAAVTSCLFYCTYCEVVGHSTHTCAKEAADKEKATKMNMDAANYKVPCCCCMLVLAILSVLLFCLASSRRQHGVLHMRSV